MKIGLIIAMQKEFDLYFAHENKVSLEKNDILTFAHCSIDNNDITACLSGMGKVNAAIHTSEMINRFHPDAILNLGVSGGIDNSLSLGDFVVGSQIVYHDVWCGEPNALGQVQDMPLYYHSSPQLINKIADIPELKQGLICCGDQFISSADKLAQIKQEFPNALAVDMESAAIAQTCFVYNTPLLCVRQISDVVGKEYQYEQYNNFLNNAAQKSFEISQKILQKL